MRAVHLFCARVVLLSSSSPLVPPPLLLLHPHTLPNTVRHFPGHHSTQSQNHPWLTGCSYHYINWHNIGKCLFSSGCSLSYAPCAPWSAVAGSRSTRCSSNLFGTLDWDKRETGCCQDTADATEEESRQRPPWRGWNCRIPHKAQWRDGKRKGPLVTSYNKGTWINH